MSKTVLIVEDNDSMRSSLARVVEDAGLKVLMASDGNTGLNLALSTKPDLVLLDIIMPEMDGMAMMENLRVNEDLKNVPIIFLTNLGDSSHILKKLISHDNTFYFIKAETKLSDIVRKINSILV